MEKSQALCAGPNAAKKPTVNDERMAQDQRLPPYPQSELPNSEPEHAESSANDGALSWVTAMKPSEFKSRSKMQSVRQIAMGSYLEANKGGARKPNMEASDHSRTNETPRSRRMTSHNTTSTLDSSLSPPHSVAESSGGTTEAVPRPLFQAHRHDHFYSTADAHEEYARPGLNTNLSSGQASSFQDPVAHTALEEGPNLKKARHGKTDIKTYRHPRREEPSAHMCTELGLLLDLNGDWEGVQTELPETWKWDVEYGNVLCHDRYGATGSWTCTPLKPDEPSIYPLTIARAPLVLPVEYRWPPSSGLGPPPDPRPAAPLDCRAEVSLEVVQDVFLTFQGIIGFYILVNGLLQIIVPDDFDTEWASSHLPHKYGGLKVCYIDRTVEPSMLPSTTETSGVGTPSKLLGSSSRRSAPPPPGRPPAQSSAKKTSLKINDFIEARPLSTHRREKYAGRIGLKVAKEGSPFVVMSTHIITEAILSKSRLETVFSLRNDARLTRLQDNWNSRVEVWANYQKMGTIEKTFDRETGSYPDGFLHDITLIKPISPTVLEDLASPVSNMGWLSHEFWTSLRHQMSTVKILADTENSQSAKSIKCSRPSDVLVVGEGIFLNQKAAARGSKSLKEHKASTWNDLVSRAILYRVYPDFDPPNGHSGTALYADGVREDGTYGPGIVGFQSFVQRSGHVQNFEMEGDALDQRLKAGRVAFYGAFEVPAELKKYDIV